MKQLINWLFKPKPKPKFSNECFIKTRIHFAKMDEAKKEQLINRLYNEIRGYKAFNTRLKNNRI